jgi:hypothetical protein
VSVRRRVAIAAVLALGASLPGPAIAGAAPPAITYSVTGTAGDGDWFRSAVTVSWSVDFSGLPPVSSTGCEPAIRLSSDTTGVALTCSAVNTDGTTTTRTRAIRIDQVPPQVTAVAPARPPDAGGWYRSPVGIAWSGTDSTSGIAACTALTYAGPDGPASPSGSCRDNAGNVSPEVPFALSYDATAPGLSAVTAAGGDTVATLQWQAAPDVVGVTVTRTPGARGAAATTVFQGLGGRFEDVGLSNRVPYSYTVTATDAAGNATTATVGARGASRLRGPRPGQRVSAPPLLEWKPVRGAQYYNVQLFRGARKVLSIWPANPRLRLHRAWRYGGHRHRLDPAVYRWFVWPGYGRRAQRRYGRLLGTRRFAVIRASAT